MQYQPSLFGPAPSPLDSSVVLLRDPRWPEALAALEAARGLGLDIETYGANDDALSPWRGEIRLIGVALPEGLTLVADLGGALDERARRQAELAPFLDALRRKLADRDVLKVGHNLAFDLLWLLVKFNMPARCVRDTMLCSRVLWAGMGAKGGRYCPTCRLSLAQACSCDTPPQTFPRLEHSLEAAAERCGLSVDKTERASDWAGRLSNAQYNYNARDAQAALAVYKVLRPRLKEAGCLVSAIIESEACPAYVEMAYRGMPVDDAELDRVLGMYRAAQAKVLEPFTERFPHVNPASPAEVLEALQRAQMPVHGTDDAALAEWKDAPPVAALLAWRSLGTQTKYLEGIAARKHGGAVRSTYNQIAPAGHGRSASRDPNLQNPANLDEHPEWKALGLPSPRAIFRAPAGKRLIVGDLSQAHARIATECSQDPVLIAAYRDGLDMHCRTAAALAAAQGKHWSPEQIAEWRKDASHPNNAACKKLRQDGKTGFYSGLNLGGSDEQKAAMRQTFKALVRFQRRQIDESSARRVRTPWAGPDYGLVRGPTGRHLYLELLPGKYGPSVKGTDCVAFTWMGAEADVIKCALGQIQRDFDEHPEWGAHLCNMAHDEVNALCGEAHAPAVAACVQARLHQAMRAVVKCIPVDEAGADPNKMICQSWADK